MDYSFTLLSTHPILTLSIYALWRIIYFDLIINPENRLVRLFLLFTRSKQIEFWHYFPLFCSVPLVLNYSMKYVIKVNIPKQSIVMQKEMLYDWIPGDEIIIIRSWFQSGVIFSLISSWAILYLHFHYLKHSAIFTVFNTYFHLKNL